MTGLMTKYFLLFGEFRKNMNVIDKLLRDIRKAIPYKRPLHEV